MHGIYLDLKSYFLAYFNKLKAARKRRYYLNMMSINNKLKDSEKKRAKCKKHNNQRCKCKYKIMAHFLPDKKGLTNRQTDRQSASQRRLDP